MGHSQGRIPGSAGNTFLGSIFITTCHSEESGPGKDHLWGQQAPLRSR